MFETPTSMKNYVYPELSGGMFYTAGDEEQFFYNIKTDKEDFLQIKNTFMYIFEKFKKSLFVQIVDNKLVTFLPFYNMKYRNEWAGILKYKNGLNSKDAIKKFLIYTDLYSKYWFNKVKYPNFSDSFQTFFTKKEKTIDCSKFNLNMSEWYANNGIFRYDKSEKISDGQNILNIFEMLRELCEKRKVKNISFFVNRRDSPILKSGSYEAYYHIFGHNFPLLSHKYSNYLPILSMSVLSNKFRDILIPTFDDWRLVIMEEKKLNLCWNKKIPKAVFRGSSTGFGFNHNNNARLRILNILDSMEPKNKQLFNVGISKWQLRPRVDDGNIRFIKPNLKHTREFLSLEKQSDYKFIIHIEGHVFAYRLSAELSTKSCILFAETDWKIWYSHLLKPYVHYVPIKKDFSDLLSQMKWCLENDKTCEEIASNGWKFQTTNITKENILVSLEETLNKC